MARARNLPQDQAELYHIYNRGNNGANLFTCEDEFLVFINVVQKCKQKYEIDIYNYCLLANHYHFLIKATGKMLAKAMQYINYSYSLAHKRMHDRIGRLWQSRYQCEPITTEEYLALCKGYVELNAIKHGIVAEAEQYPWSSYHLYAYGKPDPIVDTDPDYYDLGKTDEERRRVYIHLAKIRAASLKSMNLNDQKIDRLDL